MGEAAYFERLTLEAFQSGLSWRTILRKRPAFRAAFDGFDVERTRPYDDADRARLMLDAGIVRNRAKIDAAIINVRRHSWRSASGEGAGSRSSEPTPTRLRRHPAPAPRPTCCPKTA